MSDDRDLQEPVEAKVYITPVSPSPSRPDETERTPLQSKKFISYFLSDLMWKGVILAMVIVWKGEINQATLIVAIVACMVSQIVYVLTQGWIDKHVRIARIAKKTNKEK